MLILPHTNRTLVCRVRIIANRLSPQGRRNYKRMHIIKQAGVFDSYLYKRAECLEQYIDLSTLESRVLRIARALAINRHRLLFTRFDLRI
jgi:hypothetical protein